MGICLCRPGVLQGELCWETSWAMRPQVKAWESDFWKNIKDRMLFYVVPEVRDIGGQGRRVDIPEIPSRKEGSRG